MKIHPNLLQDEYIVKSKTPCDNNPSRCWMNIRAGKLQQRANEKKLYGFRCYVEGVNYEYVYPAEALLLLFEIKKVEIMPYQEEGKYTFYIEYATGKLYRTVSERQANENYICTLVSVSSD